MNIFRSNAYTLITEKFLNGVWEPLEQGLKATVDEIMLVEVEDLTEDKIPNHELHMDVLLATDSSGSHKQFQGKDIDIDSRNINVGKHLYSEKFVASTISISIHSRRLQAIFD